MKLKNKKLSKFAFFLSILIVLILGFILFFYYGNQKATFSTYYFQNNNTNVRFDPSIYRVEYRSGPRWSWSDKENKRTNLSLEAIAVTDKKNNSILIEGYDLNDSVQLKEFNHEGTNGEIQASKTIENSPYIVEKLLLKVNDAPNHFSEQTRYSFRTKNSGFQVDLGNLPVEDFLEIVNGLKFN